MALVSMTKGEEVAGATLARDFNREYSMDGIKQEDKVEERRQQMIQNDPNRIFQLDANKKTFNCGICYEDLPMD